MPRQQMKHITDSPLLSSHKKREDIVYKTTIIINFLEKKFSQNKYKMHKGLNSHVHIYCPEMNSNFNTGSMLI
jgi:hypothetical protein